NQTKPPPGVPSKLELAKTAISKLVSTHSSRITFGYTTFQQGSCTQGPSDGVDILDEPGTGSASSILKHVAATVSGGSTNTALAVRKVTADPKMKIPGKPSFVILITDGDPN